MHDLHALLSQPRTVAVVGCSDDPSRTSFRIAQYMQDAGFRIIPVNPYREEILGEKCYARVEDIPPAADLDIVCIFRRPQNTAKMVESTVRWAEEAESKPVVWTQLGVHSSEAEALADAASLPYVRNRCLMVEHARLG